MKELNTALVILGVAGFFALGLGSVGLETGSGAAMYGNIDQGGNQIGGDRPYPLPEPKPPIDHDGDGWIYTGTAGGDCDDMNPALNVYGRGECVPSPNGGMSKWMYTCSKTGPGLTMMQCTKGCYESRTAGMPDDCRN